MSRIRANTIVNGAGTGAPNFPRGAIISGISTINAEINVGTGASISSPATNELAFGTNSSERIRIDAQGAIIGSGLQTNNDGRNLKGLNVKSPAGVSFQNFGANGSRNWRIRPDDMSDWGNLDFSVSPTTNNDTDWPDSAADIVLTLDENKDVIVKNGNLVIGTSGKGIDFSATSDGSGTTTSELLDDYEEGTFTPNLLLYASGSILETISPLSSSFKGRYTKIGNRVWIEVYTRYNLSTITTSAWTQTLIELPFAQGAYGGQQYSPAFIGYYANFLTYPQSTDSYHYFPGAYVGSSTNYMYLTINRMTAAETYIDETNISSNTSAGIMVSANYSIESI